MSEEAEALQSLEATLRVSDRHIDQEAERGNTHTLDLTVQSHIPVLTFRYVHTTRPSSLMEAELHHLWYTVLKAAERWDVANPKQDTLIRYILGAKARGTLTRPLVTVGDDGANEGEDDRLEAVPCSDGRMFWSGLPFLGQDLIKEWNRCFCAAEARGETDVRCNLAAFVGRLISVGIWHGPAACALILFREALETPRGLIPETPDYNDQGRESKALSVQTLVIALQQMLYYTQGNVIYLGNTNLHVEEAGLSPEDSRLGEIAVRSGITSTGWNPPRWRFWLRRLEELSKCESPEIADSAECCLDVMRSAAENIYGPLAGKLHRG